MNDEQDQFHDTLYGLPVQREIAREEQRAYVDDARARLDALEEQSRFLSSGIRKRESFEEGLVQRTQAALAEARQQLALLQAADPEKWDLRQESVEQSLARLAQLLGMLRETWEAARKRPPATGSA